MKKTTILGSVLAGFLLLMVPQVNAIQYKEVTEIVTHQYQQRIQTMRSYVAENFITELIDLLLRIIGYIYTTIEKVLAFIAFIVLLGGHRDPDDSPLYQILYVLYLLNLFLTQSLINILTLISSLFDGSMEKKSQICTM